MHWIKISCILCVFGSFKDFRPSESFVTDYLTGPWKNFTRDEVNRDIYPVSVYSYTTMLILMFLITDFVRYKPIIILCGLSGLTTFVLLICGKTVLVMQIKQFFFGLFMSAEVAYYTYIYAKVDKKYYQEVTGHTKAASLFGRSLSGIVAQLTVSFDLLDYFQLNFLTISAFIIATIWSFFLPSVSQSIYFHRVNDSSEDEYTATEKKEIRQSQHCGQLWLCCCKSSYDENDTTHSLFRKTAKAYTLLWKHFVQAYTNYRVLKWSIWWALGSSGFLQVTSYMQLLWQTAVHPTDKIYNGAVDCIFAILGTVSVFCISKMRLNWILIGDLTLAICSFLEGGMLMAFSYSYNIWFLYSGYIIFVVIYHTLCTIASFEVAKYICKDSYGLIFGVNIFFGLMVQSFLTLVVVNMIKVNIRQQYFIYGIYFIVLATIYIVLGIINVVQYRRNNERINLWISHDDDDWRQQYNRDE